MFEFSAGFSRLSHSSYPAACPAGLRNDLLKVRGLIREAAEKAGIGALVEPLKWGQPAYMPTRPRIGATIGIDAFGSYDHDAAFFHCRTDLVQTFRVLYPEEFAFHRRRAIVFPVGAGLPADALRHCLSPALTYHLQPECGRRRLTPFG